MNKLDTVYHFIILTPHRDALKSLREYRQKLFSMGITGAHSFPLTAPLAELSRPIGREELKELAENIHQLSRNDDGKISSGPAVIAQCRDRFSFYGPELIIPAKNKIFPAEIKRKIITPFAQVVLCAALLLDGEKAAGDAPAPTFRAAALTNLEIHPLNEAGYSLEWKIGPPVWLPNTHRIV